MVGTVNDGSASISTYPRLLLIGVGAVLVALLLAAACLQPDERGYGTHRQLGLPPCTFQQLFGARCPSCGMTTAWSHFVRGQFVRSLRANPGGSLLALVATLTAPWLILSGVRGSWVGARPNEWIVVGLMIAIVAITLIDWGIRGYGP